MRNVITKKVEMTLNKNELEVIKQNEFNYLLNNVDLDLQILSATLDLVINDLEQLFNDGINVNKTSNIDLQIHYAKRSEGHLRNFYLVLTRIQEDLNEVTTTVGQLAGN